MIRKGTCVIVGLLVFGAAGCGSSGDKASSGSDEVTVTLGEQNGSGESGSATLTKVGAQTKVVINLESMSASMGSVAQPAHIHHGSCVNLDPTPAYALADVKNGKSTSTVGATLDDLGSGGFAINVHMSSAQIQTYVACGDIGTGESGSGGSSGKY
ncbi:MAG: hypothetical protein AABM30_09590 [Actinomycetota bacterium]